MGCGRVGGAVTDLRPPAAGAEQRAREWPLATARCPSRSPPLRDTFAPGYNEQEVSKRRVCLAPETMEALHRGGAIATQMMRRFDEACLKHAVPPTTPKVKPVGKRKCARRTVAL